MKRQALLFALAFLFAAIMVLGLAVLLTEQAADARRLTDEHRRALDLRESLRQRFEEVEWLDFDATAGG